jgi:hypothetical protein
MFGRAAPTSKLRIHKNQPELATPDLYFGAGLAGSRTAYLEEGDGAK